MDKPVLPPRVPRLLSYRDLYKWYWGLQALILAFYVVFFAYVLWQKGINNFWFNYKWEIISGIFYSCIFCGYSFYCFWRSSFKTVQVYENKFIFHRKNKSDEYLFSEVQSIHWIFRSWFMVKMKSGQNIYFSSMIERLDYVWEGFFAARSDLFISLDWFEKKRIQLVQYDHHEKRKEWFFTSKLIDLFQWFLAPTFLMFIGYQVQSQTIQIHSLETYFFRLTMFATLTLLYCSLVTSFFLKKFVFDQVVKKQMAGPNANKLRNLEREKMLLRKGKHFQLWLSVFIFGFVMYSDINLFSVTRIKTDFSYWDLPKGKTVFIDNRYNCLNCKYKVSEGDKILFSKGYVGVVMALEGESMAFIRDTDVNNRTIASEDIIKVPAKHIMVKTGKNKDEFLMLKITDLVGKIKSP